MNMNNLVLCHDIYDANVLSHCCGILEIGGLELHTKDEDEDLRDFEVTPERLLKEHKVGLVLATTTTAQQEINLKLLELGFKELETAKNPRTKNTVIMWSYKKEPAVRKRAIKC